MTMIIESCDDRSRWEAFLETQDTPTFLQSWEWQEFNQMQGYKTFPLLILVDQEIKGVALFLKIPAKRGTHLLCAHGPILSKEIDPDTVLPLITKHVSTLGQQERCDFVRLCPLMPDGRASAALFRASGYRPAPIHQSPELSWILSLAPSEEELLKHMRKATRYTINRREKDAITIESSEDPADLDRFWEVYRETADRQNFTPFSRSYLENEFQTFHRQKRARLFFGSYQGKTISTAMIIFSGASAFYHHGASSHAFSKINASCTVQWEAICEAKRRGCRWYNFWGIAPPEQPKHPWAGLTLFKMGFGGEAQAYLHAQDKPLTKKYWLNYLLETIRARKRGFRYPDPLAT